MSVRLSALIFGAAMLLAVLTIPSQAAAWSNGGYSADPSHPDYGTHDWIAQHAMDWLPSAEKAYIVNNQAVYLYGTELPDNGGASDGIGDQTKHHVYYYSGGSLQDDASAVRASQEFETAKSYLMASNFYMAAKTAGIMSHYIVDVGVFGHVMGSSTDWGAEVHHSDYEDYVTARMTSYTSSMFDPYLVFDGTLETLSAYSATLRVARATTFGDSAGTQSCVWMDTNYDWSDPAFKNSAGASLNRAVNALADALHALAVETMPSSPRDLQGISGNSQVVLSWQAPSSEGGSPISGYRVYRGTASGAESFLVQLGNTLTYTNTGLANGVRYYYQVSAVNAAGEGPRSVEATAVPATTPSSPRNLAATPGDGQIILSWQAPSSDGGSSVTGYRLYRGTSPGGESLLEEFGNVHSYADTGLANAATYYYEVSAVNALGEGLRSAEVFATPAEATAPSATLYLTATGGDREVTLHWRAPSSDGGSLITSYRVHRGTAPGGESYLTTLGNVLEYTDSGLTNGVTYYYQVSAANAIGEGAKSNEASAVPTAADTTKPSVTMTSPTSGSTLTSQTITVSGTASDDVAVQKVELSTDGTTWISATGTTSWSGVLTLVEGQNTIYARATDTSGNAATATISVLVQSPTTGPSPQSLDPMAVGLISAVVAGLAAASVALVLVRRKRQSGRER